MPLSGAPGPGRRTADGERAQLARFLRDRRGRLDPAACGFAHGGRRRTPGLRREEVAQLAGVSVTWYTWLEQGGRRRMGVPSTDTLDGIAVALRLDRAERDHLYLLAHGRPPPRSTLAGSVTVPASVRQLVDALGACPALVRTDDTWDVVAWNRAAVAVFGDYAGVPAAGRNMLRRVFVGGGAKSVMPDWDRDARRVVAAFRGGVARAGPSPAVDALVTELSAASPEFARWWRDDRGVAADAAGTKRLDHPAAGPLSLSYAGLTPQSVEGLTVTVFVPSTDADRRAVEHLTAASVMGPGRGGPDHGSRAAEGGNGR